MAVHQVSLAQQLWKSMEIVLQTQLQTTELRVKDTGKLSKGVDTVCAND